MSKRGCVDCQQALANDCQQAKVKCCSLVSVAYHVSIMKTITLRCLSSRFAAGTAVGTHLCRDRYFFIIDGGIVFLPLKKKKGEIKF